MTDTCYMCDSISTSKEHVPPRCLFPEQKDLPEGVDLRRQLFKVPSCDVHNTSKSKDDEYLLYCLLLSIPANKIGENHFLTKVKRAIDRNPNLIKQFLEHQKPVTVENHGEKKLENTIAVKIDTDRLENELECLTRALYFFHFKEKWEGSLNVYPAFLLFLEQDCVPNNKLIEKMDHLSNELFLHADFFGENPDVFKYQVIDGGDACHKFFRLHFYSGNRVTVFVGKKG